MLFQGPSAFGAFAMGLSAGKVEFFAQGISGRNALRRFLPWLVVAGVPISIACGASMAELLAPEQGLLLLIGFAGTLLVARCLRQAIYI